MSTNTQSNHQMPQFNNVQKNQPNSKIHNFPKFSVRSILPNKSSSSAMDFTKKLDAAIEKLSKKAMSFCKKLARGISRLIRAYLIFLLVCVLITIGYCYLFNLVETNPGIVETVPGIVGFLDSAKTLVNYISQFLQMTIEGAIEYIEAFIAEMNSSI